MKVAGLCFAFVLVGFFPVRAGVEAEGFLSLRAWDSDGPASWLAGGWGKTMGGAGEEQAGIAQLQASVTWEPSLYFKARLHGLARLEPDSYEGDAGGLVEAWIEARAFLSETHRLRFRLGLFFPPTSLENVDPLWSSPYSLNFSALNSWIGEEVRPTGLDVNYTIDLSEDKLLFFGVTAFIGNDTAGTQLAWRGWASGDRLTVYGEFLPLPALQSLSQEDYGPFYLQRNEGSRPFGGDLDSELGYSLRAGVDLGGFILQANWFDNRADRKLYDGEYAWATDYVDVGLEWPLSENMIVVAQFMDGSTGMGPYKAEHVQVGFQTWFVLASLSLGDWRMSLRSESFETTDLDKIRFPVNADLNDEDGDSVTATLFYQPLTWLRLGLEYQDLEVWRDAFLQGIEQPRHLSGGDMLSLETRIVF